MKNVAINLQEETCYLPPAFVMSVSNRLTKYVLYRHIAAGYRDVRVDVGRVSTVDTAATEILWKCECG